MHVDTEAFLKRRHAYLTYTARLSRNQTEGSPALGGGPTGPPLLVIQTRSALGPTPGTSCQKNKILRVCITEEDFENDRRDIDRIAGQ